MSPFEHLSLDLEVGLFVRMSLSRRILVDSVRLVIFIRRSYELGVFGLNVVKTSDVCG